MPRPYPSYPEDIRDVKKDLTEMRTKYNLKVTECGKKSIEGTSYTKIVRVSKNAAIANFCVASILLT